MSGKNGKIVLEEDEFQKIVAEVEGAMAQIRPAHSLQKAQDADEDDKGEASAAPEASSPAPDASASAPASPDASPAPAPDASASAGPAPAPSADPAAPGAEGGEEAPETVETLTAKYDGLEESELKMHYLAAKAALMKKMQSAAPAPGASPSAAPPMAPSPSASPAPAPAPAMKAEIAAAPANGGQMLKSEQAEVALAKAQVEQLSQQFQVLARAVELLAQPQRKAITGINQGFLAKTEESTNKPAMTKDQVLAKLKNRVSDPSLSKSDRNLINKYSVGSIDVSQIEHLLK